MPQRLSPQRGIIFSFKLRHPKNLSSYGFREEEFFLSFFSYFKCMEANKPLGVANLDPTGMVSRIYVGVH